MSSDKPIRIKLFASAFSNCTYNRKEIVDGDYTEAEWAEMSQKERDDYLDEYASNWIHDDIDYGAEVE
jgi:hypothetical protein